MQLTQLNSVQPISAKQISGVFVPTAALWCVIYQPATLISWEMFSSAAAFFTRSLKALVDMSYKQACFFHNSINFSSNYLLQTSQNTSYMTSWPTNWVNRVTTFRTDRCNSCSRCKRVDNSTSSWVELCRYKCPLKQVALLSQRGRAMLCVCQLLASIVQCTKRRAQSFIVSYIGYRWNHCVQLNAVLLSLA